MLRPEIAEEARRTPAIAGDFGVTLSLPYRTRSTSPGRQVLSKKDASGL